MAQFDMFRRIGISAIAGDIKRALDKVAQAHRAKSGLSDAEWADRVLKEIGDLGRALGCKVRAGSNAQWDGPALMHDLSWLSYDSRERLKRAPLALQCCWDSNADVDNAFQKLLLTRSDLRVMVMSAPTETYLSTAFTHLKELAKEYDGGTADDVYLCCGWSDEGRQFHYAEFDG